MFYNCTDCGKLSNPENGTVSVTLTTYLSVADYKCETGFYNSSGDWQRTCQADGTWSGTELQCLIYGRYFVDVTKISNQKTN
jgi:hypothetical protein